MFKFTLGKINECLLLYTGIVIFLFGIIFKLFPPKHLDSINSIWGYKTELSTKNEDTWREANSFGAKLMLICGIICIVLGITCYYFTKGYFSKYQGIIAITLVLVPAVYTEVHLRKVFDEEGIRKI